MNIREFLAARLDEDQEEANVARMVYQGSVLAGRWGDDPPPFDSLGIFAQGLGTEDHQGGAVIWLGPERFAQEILVRRRLIQGHAPQDDVPDACVICGPEHESWQTHPNADVTIWWEYPCWTLKLQALPYAGHPDYQEEWRV